MPEHEREVLKDFQRKRQAAQLRYRGLDVVWGGCEREVAILPDGVARFGLSMFWLAYTTGIHDQPGLHMTPEREVSMADEFNICMLIRLVGLPQRRPLPAVFV